MAPSLTRIIFVLGKGGVGRSTVSASLGLALAARGKRVLVLEWSVAEAIAPWFGRPPAGTAPVEVAERLSVASYDLDEALRAYFVDHLGLEIFHRRIVRGAALRRLIDAAPGIAELLYVGQLWWLTTLAEKEAGLAFDHIVVDAPATGHGAAILDLPSTLTSLRAGGLLGLEIERVAGMMKDPQWAGALVVTLAEELAARETRELVPRVTRALGRPPLALVVNRSVASAVDLAAPPTWLSAVGASLPEGDVEALAILDGELRTRARIERELRAALAGATARGILSIDDRLVSVGDPDPRAVCLAGAAALGGLVEVA